MISKHDFEYRSNNDFPIVKEGFKGNFFRDGLFFNNGMGETTIGFSDIFAWKFSTNPQSAEKKNEKYKLITIENRDIFKAKGDVIVWLGHATFFIRLGGVSIITDPLLVKNSLISRQINFVCQADDIKNIEYLLLSHNHRDHLDSGSLEVLLKNNPSMKALLPLGLGETYQTITGAGKFSEAGWWQKYETSSVEIFLVPAKHWSRRWVLDKNRSLWGAFIIRYKNLKIFFAGDTAYNIHFREVREVFGDIDICILPIGAYKPEYIMKQSHMSPEEAVQAFHDLGGKIFVPMHYGTYDLSDEPLGEPVSIIKKLDQEKKIKGKVIFLSPGDEMNMERNVNQDG